MQALTEVIQESTAILAETNPYAHLFIIGTSWVYKIVMSPRALVDIEGNVNFQDRRQYDRLCNFRLKISHTKTLPSHWEIDLVTGCPKYEVSFKENAKKLRTLVEDVNASDFPQKLMVSSIVSKIENLFECLQMNKAKFSLFDATYSGYRVDGYEAMFFGDLALWLSVSLPRLDVKKSDTAKQVAEWTDYCNKVNKRVLLYRNDELIANNPKEKLNDIIFDLENLHNNICIANKASSFNDRLQSINFLFLDMSKHVFDFFYLLLNKSSSNGLDICSFIKHSHPMPGMNIDPKIAPLVEYQMGRWIIESLNRAGIKNNDFENHLFIKITEIENHLNDDLSGIRDLRVTGLWKFARRNKDQPNQYLHELIALHRTLMRLYFVRDSAVLAALVDKDLGNSWVYGQEKGKEMLYVLMKVIYDASSAMTDGINHFWHEFYQTDYENYSKLLKKKDHKDACYSQLDEANNVVVKINQCYQSIKSKINEIHQDSESYEHDPEPTDAKLVRLHSGLFSYVEKYRLNISDAPNFCIPHYKMAAEPVVVTTTRYLTVGEGRSYENDIHVKYSLESIPYYARISRLLQSLDPLPDQNIILRPSAFHSLIQQYIYDSLLVACQGAIYCPDWLATLFQMDSSKMPDFRKLYQQVNSVMHILYDQSSDGVSPELSFIEITLVDRLISKTINDDFNHHYYYKGQFMFPHSPVDVQPFSEQEIKIIINRDWALMSRDLLGNELNSMANLMNQKEIMIVNLKTERDGILRESAEKDAQLAKKDAQLAEQASQLAKKDAQLVEQASHQAEQDALIADLNSYLATTKGTTSVKSTSSMPPKSTLFKPQKVKTQQDQDFLSEDKTTTASASHVSVAKRHHSLFSSMLGAKSLSGMSSVSTKKGAVLTSAHEKLIHATKM